MKSAEATFIEFLSRNGLRMTGQRRAILDAFHRSQRHLSVEEIYDIVRQSGAGVGIATVWRNMKLILAAGLAEEHHFLDGRIRYEQRAPRAHGHMVCTSCGRPVEFDLGQVSPFLRQVAKANSFAVEDVKISLFGKCFLCLGKTRGDRKTGRHE